MWKMANGTTMPAARSSRLGVSTHSTAGRCRQETHKSPSTRWNHALVTRRRDGARAISIAGVCPPETRGLCRPRTQDDGLHKAAFVLQGKASFPLHLEEISQGGLARSHMTHKLKQNKGAHFEPATGEGWLRERDELHSASVYLISWKERVAGPGHFPEAKQESKAACTRSVCPTAGTKVKLLVKLPLDLDKGLPGTTTQELSYLSSVAPPQTQVTRSVYADTHLHSLCWGWGAETGRRLGLLASKPRLLTEFQVNDILFQSKTKNNSKK